MLTLLVSCKIYPIFRVELQFWILKTASYSRCFINVQTVYSIKIIVTIYRVILMLIMDALLNKHCPSIAKTQSRPKDKKCNKIQRQNYLRDHKLFLEKCLKQINSPPTLNSHYNWWFLTNFSAMECCKWKHTNLFIKLSSFEQRGHEMK